MKAYLICGYDAILLQMQQLPILKYEMAHKTDISYQLPINSGIIPKHIQGFEKFRSNAFILNTIHCCSTATGDPFILQFL